MICMDEETLNRFEKFLDKTNGCWLWTGCCENQGYGQFKYEGKRWYVHRLMYLHCYGELPEKPLDILHKCKPKNCCNPEHLEAGTKSKNLGIDRHRDGTMTHAKLIAEQVVEIRQRTDKSQRELGLEYGVSESNISNIILRKSWTHI
jgi:hypothetical protein